MEILEKYYTGVREVSDFDYDRIEQVNKLKQEYNQKLEVAYDTMMAKEYENYKRDLTNHYAKLGSKFAEKNLEQKYLYYLHYGESIKVDVVKFFNEISKFLSKETGEPFTVEKATEKYCYDYGSGYADYCDVDVFKVMCKDKEIFRSNIFYKDEKDYTQRVLLSPDEYSKHGYDFGNLSLILPIEKTKKIFDFILKQPHFGFHGSYEENVNQVTNYIKKREALLKSISPDFDYYKLSKFMLHYINQNAMVKTEPNSLEQK